MAGSFTHTILEWSAFTMAIFAMLLALIHFTIRRDVATPIVGVALFCAGTMDAFHTLAADRLIHAVADNHNLIPFTWAICRLFNALIMLSGVSVLLLRNGKHKTTGVRFVLTTSLAFGVMAYGIIHLCATSSRLPQTMFPDSIVTRPWDIAPLVVFLLTGEAHRSCWPACLFFRASIASQAHPVFALARHKRRPADCDPASHGLWVGGTV